ncbi:MAG: methyltransferase domain-containing protein [Minicystis sp.]
MDTKEALSEAYDRSATAYDQTAGGIYLRALWSLLPYANVAPLPAILDIGCGTGINLLEMARVLGPCRKLVGVDLSPGMLSVARRKAVSAGLPAAFMIGDAEALELPDSSFDLVVCNSAYHWFPDRARAIKEMSRVLKPGGQLILTTLAAPGYEEWIGVVNSVWARLFGRACAAFPEMPTPAEVSAQIRGSGLSIEHFKYQIMPAVVNDPQGFLSTMAVVAPVWLAQAPDGDGQRVLQATLDAIKQIAPQGFVCTNAGIEVVARKGAAIPPSPTRMGPPVPPAPKPGP